MRRSKFWLIILAFVLLIPAVLPAQAAHAQWCTPRADWTNTYQVVRGDNLYRIALRYGTNVTTLAQGNCLVNSNIIYVGQVLRVPGSGSTPTGTVRLPVATSVFELPYGATLATAQAGNVTALGRTADTLWVFIRAGNMQGWVWTYQLDMNNVVYNLPIVSTRGSVDPTPGTNCTQYLTSRLAGNIQARVLPGLPNNLRASYSTQSAWVGLLPGGTVFTVIGGPQCNQGILWWQVNANGMIGWTGELQGTSYWVEPLTADPSSGTATVTAYYLNVRNAPNAWAGILTRIQRGQSFGITGRLADNTWVQLNINGTIGWVNASYVTTSNLQNAPIIW